jgi:ankyrin repeat protein
MKQQRVTIGSPNYQDPFGNTLLHGAVISGNIDDVERLLAAGADPNIANRDGRTPLHAAAIFGHWRLYDVLVAAGRER